MGGGFTRQTQAHLPFLADALHKRVVVATVGGPGVDHDSEQRVVCVRPVLLLLVPRAWRRGFFLALSFWSDAIAGNLYKNRRQKKITRGKEEEEEEEPGLVFLLVAPASRGLGCGSNPAGRSRHLHPGWIRAVVWYAVLLATERGCCGCTSLPWRANRDSGCACPPVALGAARHTVRNARPYPFLYGWFTVSLRHPICMQYMHLRGDARATRVKT